MATRPALDGKTLGSTPSPGAIQAALICPQCGNVFLRIKKRYTYAIRHGERMICSDACRIAARRTRKLVRCAGCGADIWRVPKDIAESKSGENFCSKSCANVKHNRSRSGEKHPLYDGGRTTYRERAFAKYGKACTICGYDIECVLEVHHRDGNRRNNKIENLDVLCPTHHDEFEHGIRSYDEEKAAILYEGGCLADGVTTATRLILAQETLGSKPSPPTKF